MCSLRPEVGTACHIGCFRRRRIAEERESMTQQGITQGESVPGDGELGVTIARVIFDHHRDAFGVGESRPRLSWRVDTMAPAWCQACYQLEAYGSDGRLCERTDKVE